jgi:hypothetical protein
MLSYAPHASQHPHATPLEKGLANDLSPIWLKPPKMIVSFITKALVQMTPKTSLVCGRYQFVGFYVK